MKSFVSINPYSEEVIASHHPATTEEIEYVIQQAYVAQKEWKKTPVKHRNELLLALGKEITNQCDQLAKLASDEMGKLYHEAKAEVMKCVTLCTYYASHTEQFLIPQETLLDNGRKVLLTHEPVGTVLGIFPWNFPFWQILRSAIPVIASGNTMIIKPAPNTILCSMALQNIIEQCGYPIGVYTTLIANETDVANIISDDRIAACTLTGSEAAGSAVATLSGKYIKKSVLELGGSDPFIITETANLPVAASKAVQARFQNTGQSCIAAKRLIVHQNIYAEFLGLFLAEVKQLKLGSPLDAHTTLGPMARKDLVNTIHSQVNDALSKGAQILYQHLDVPAKGFFYPPTVISKIQPNMRMYHEEVFGPVFALYTYNSIDELINIANDNRYGLGATVWSDDKNTALNIASELACGQVFINEILRSDARFPFGGTKKSGFGRELGPNGFFEFCYTKTINLASHS